MSLKSLLSSARGSIGIWSELRKLRQLFEWYLQNTEIGLPPSTRDATASKLDPSEHTILDEDTEADLAVAQLLRDLGEGKDPGTKWRPW